MQRNYTKIEKEIAETGFFSEYLPPCFKLDKKVFLCSPPEKCDLISPYCFTMSRYNGNDARRNIFIPEIGAYIAVRNYFRSENIVKEMIEFTESEDSSFSPIISKDNTVMRHEQSYEGAVTYADEIPSCYIENIIKKIIKSSGAKKILRLDISNCFSSFYMHMVPAILLGLEETEENFNKFLRDHTDTTIDHLYLKYRKLDEVLRQQNQNRTNGLLTGILSSKIIIEGILTRIDKELKEKGLIFSRYIDDYEVYLFNDDEKTTVSIFTGILKRYGFSLNNEKTETIDFPYYMAENLEKIFASYDKANLDSPVLMEMFNAFSLLEKNGVKGAIRFLLKSIEKKPIAGDNSQLYKAYLLTIIKNNERSLTKACSLLIKNKEILNINENDIKILTDMLHIHIEYEHDLEVLWLLYLLIETDNIDSANPIIENIIAGKSELAHILLLRRQILKPEQIEQVKNNATSWILLYELYVNGHITESVFKGKLNLNKNTAMYQKLKQKNIHFCS